MGVARVKKTSYFDDFSNKGWPSVEQLRPYFLAPAGKEWFYTGGNDAAALWGEGLNGTAHLEPGKGRVDVSFELWGHPKHGVLIIYSKRGGDYNEMFTTKGNLNRLGELVRNLHDTPLPVGLFIPFRTAWPAVKEFIETDGELPKSIEWISNYDLPPNTFPDP
jgi:hypothetical protein